MMPARFQWRKAKPREVFFIFAAICLLIAPEFIMRVTVFDTVVVLQLAVLALLALSFAWPLWVFYRAFLKGPLRARRIEKIRQERLLREITEERKN
jgi:hypothetical protein